MCHCVTCGGPPLCRIVAACGINEAHQFRVSCVHRVVWDVMIASCCCRCRVIRQRVHSSVSVECDSPVFSCPQAFRCGFETMMVECGGIGTMFGHERNCTSCVWSATDACEHHFSWQGAVQEPLLQLWFCVLGSSFFWSISVVLDLVECVHPKWSCFVRVVFVVVCFPSM